MSWDLLKIEKMLEIEKLLRFCMPHKNYLDDDNKYFR